MYSRNYYINWKTLLISGLQEKASTPNRVPSPRLDQLSLIQLEPIFYALIASNTGTTHKEETDNLISFVKTSNEVIWVKLLGNFHVDNPNLASDILVKTELFGPDEGIVESNSYNTFEIEHDAIVNADAT